MPRIHELVRKGHITTKHHAFYSLSLWSALQHHTHAHLSGLSAKNRSADSKMLKMIVAKKSTCRRHNSSKSWT